LLRLARRAIAHQLGGPPVVEPEGAWFHEPAATFVTITRFGDLHGCIGSIEPARALWKDIVHNAVAAAFYDPRSRPLRSDELGDIRIEVSLLSPLSPMAFGNEADALSQIRPHEDGIVLVVGRRRATFLPQVWAKLPDRREFMEHLKMKAGLPPGYWSDSVELYRYSLEKWSEEPEEIAA
jgi:hypothetical protein